MGPEIAGGGGTGSAVSGCTCWARRGTQPLGPALTVPAPVEGRAEARADGGGGCGRRREAVEEVRRRHEAETEAEAEAGRRRASVVEARRRHKADRA